MGSPIKSPPEGSGVARRRPDSGTHVQKPLYNSPAKVLNIIDQSVCFGLLV